MTVKLFSSKLSAYVDGDLSEADRAEMKKKISESPACLAMYENMVLLQDQLGNLPRMQPSAEFKVRLRCRIMLEATKETNTRNAGQWL